MEPDQREIAGYWTFSAEDRYSEQLQTTYTFAKSARNYISYTGETFWLL